MPLLRCLRNARFLMRSSKARVSTPPQDSHLTSLSQWRTLCWAQESFKKTLNRRLLKAWPLRKFTALTTIDNTCFWMFRACIPENFDDSYPLFWCFVPSRGTCAPG